MPQRVVGEHTRDHRLADRHGPDANARIMPSFGGDLGILSMHIDGLARRED